MMISIRHEAALSKLQVNIEEAKNLPKAHLTGLNPGKVFFHLSSLYCKLIDAHEKYIKNLLELQMEEHIVQIQDPREWDTHYK